MLKKTLNLIELFIIAFIIWGIFGFYEEINSSPRFTTKIGSLRIMIDLIIISTLLFRAIQIIRNFKKEYFELGKLKTIEKIVYVICITSIIPDLSTWFQWNYFVNLYLHFFIIFTIPILLWTVEIIERVSTKFTKLRNYGLSFILFIVLIVGYTIYLSGIN